MTLIEKCSFDARLMTMNSENLKKPIRHLTGEAKWKDIEDLVRRWARRNPREFMATKEYVNEIKEGLKDKKFGMMGGAKNGIGGGTRIGIAIHPQLMTFIQAFYPDFMDSNSDLAEFKKRFPAFRIPEN